MNGQSKGLRITGWVILGLVAAVMVAAGSFGLFGAPPEDMKQVAPGIYEYGKLISIVQLAALLLLLIPRTSSLGILLVSAFWGGAICFHVVRKEIAVLIPAVVLALTWIGAALRDPAVLQSFWKK